MDRNSVQFLNELEKGLHNGKINKWREAAVSTNSKEKEKLSKQQLTVK